METYFCESDNSVTVTIKETKALDEWTTVVNLKKLNEALKGLALLGKKVKLIKLHEPVYLDIDSPYYKKYGEENMDRFYKSFNYSSDKYFLTFKNNRLYTEFEGREIILPESLHDLYSGCDNPELTIEILY